MYYYYWPLVVLLYFLHFIILCCCAQQRLLIIDYHYGEEKEERRKNLNIALVNCSMSEITYEREEQVVTSTTKQETLLCIFYGDKTMTNFANFLCSCLLLLLHAR